MAVQATSVHLAILVALSAGPLALIALGRMLPTGRDFGQELRDLLASGWVRGPCGFLCELELTEQGRRTLERSAGISALSAAV